MAETKPKGRPSWRIYERLQWAGQVVFAALPLALFLSIIWVFMGSDQQLRSVGKAIEAPSDELVTYVTYATTRVGVVVMDYSIHVYVHLIVSLVATCYFVMVMRNHARARSLAVKFEFGFAMLFALAVGAIVVNMTIGQPLLTFSSVFSDLYICPFQELFHLLELKDELPGHSWGPLTFFHVSVLMPTFFGLVAVVFCTAAFHHVVCSRRPMETNAGQDDIVQCVTTMKRQLTFLSLVLVTSVLTSRAYAYMLPSLLDPNETAHKAYSDLASTLSFAGSMLFTATLFAAFAPGVVSLLTELAHLSSGDKLGGLKAIMERLNVSKPAGQFVGILRVVLTLAAPALADPVMDVLPIK